MVFCTPHPRWPRTVNLGWEEKEKGGETEGRRTEDGEGESAHHDRGGPVRTKSLEVSRNYILEIGHTWTF